MAKNRSREDAQVRLPELCTDCLVLTIQLRSAPDYGDPTVLRRRIRDLLDRLEREARSAGIGAEEIRDAVFPLVAFIDETINGSNWSQKDEWMAQPLQMEIYNLNYAGREFFTRLDQLRRRPQENRDLLEVYYLCLALGFKGEYVLQGPDSIRYLIEDLHREIGPREAGTIEDNLSPHGKRREELLDVTREIPAWVVAVAAAAAGFFFYLGMTILMNNTANGILRSVENLR